MKSKMNLTFACAVAIGLGSLFGYTGCGGASIDGVCDTSCDCSKCSDKERSECKADGEKAEKNADDAKCSDEFNKYIDCFSSKATCKSGVYTTKDCDQEEKTYTACVNAAPNGENDCDKAVTHVNQCVN